MSAQHLKPRWLSVASALQAKAMTQNGNAIITISIVVDKEGTPIVWTEPSRKFISPRNQGLNWIRDILTDE
jgi:hypothetical protein